MKIHGYTGDFQGPVLKTRQLVSPLMENMDIEIILEMAIQRLGQNTRCYLGDGESFMDIKHHSPIGHTGLKYIKVNDMWNNGWVEIADEELYFINVEQLSNI
jgi:hypothetical protein